MDATGSIEFQSGLNMVWDIGKNSSITGDSRLYNNLSNNL